MDNYQKNLLNKGTFDFESEAGKEKIKINEEIILYQNENYRIGGYKIIINNIAIESILYCNKKYSPNKNKTIEIDFDFNKIGENLIFVFKNAVADDCSLPIKAILADRESFDTKEAETNYEKLVNKVALILSKGNALINAYWKKSDETVLKTIIHLHYFDEATGNEYLIEESENNGEYKSISGLAYGNYRFNVEQYDSKGKLIVSVSKVITLNNDIEELKHLLSEGLNGVKNQVRASGIHTVVI